MPQKARLQSLNKIIDFICKTLESKIISRETIDFAKEFSDENRQTAVAISHKKDIQINVLKSLVEISRVYFFETEVYRYELPVLIDVQRYYTCLFESLTNTRSSQLTKADFSENSIKLFNLCLRFAPKRLTRKIDLIKKQPLFAEIIYEPMIGNPNIFPSTTMSFRVTLTGIQNAQTEYITFIAHPDTAKSMEIVDAPIKKIDKLIKKIKIECNTFEKTLHDFNLQLAHSLHRITKLHLYKENDNVNKSILKTFDYLAKMLRHAKCADIILYIYKESRFIAITKFLEYLPICRDYQVTKQHLDALNKLKDFLFRFYPKSEHSKKIASLYLDLYCQYTVNNSKNPYPIEKNLFPVTQGKSINNKRNIYYGNLLNVTQAVLSREKNLKKSSGFKTVINLIAIKTNEVNKIYMTACEVFSIMNMLNALNNHALLLLLEDYENILLHDNIHQLIDFIGTYLQPFQYRVAPSTNAISRIFTVKGVIEDFFTKNINKINENRDRTHDLLKYEFFHRKNDLMLSTYQIIIDNEGTFQKGTHKFYTVPMHYALTFLNTIIKEENLHLVNFNQLAETFDTLLPTLNFDNETLYQIALINLVTMLVATKLAPEHAYISDDFHKNILNSIETISSLRQILKKENYEKIATLPLAVTDIFKVLTLQSHLQLKTKRGLSKRRINEFICAKLENEFNKLDISKQLLPSISSKSKLVLSLIKKLENFHEKATEIYGQRPSRLIHFLTSHIDALNGKFVEAPKVEEVKSQAITVNPLEKIFNLNESLREFFAELKDAASSIKTKTIQRQAQKLSTLIETAFKQNTKKIQIFFDNIINGIIKNCSHNSNLTDALFTTVKKDLLPKIPSKFIKQFSIKIKLLYLESISTKNKMAQKELLFYYYQSIKTPCPDYVEITDKDKKLFAESSFQDESISKAMRKRIRQLDIQIEKQYKLTLKSQIELTTPEPTQHDRTDEIAFITSAFAMSVAPASTSKKSKLKNNRSTTNQTKPPVLSRHKERVTKKKSKKIRKKTYPQPGASSLAQQKNKSKDKTSSPSFQPKTIRPSAKTVSPQLSFRQALEGAAPSTLPELDSTLTKTTIGSRSAKLSFFQPSTFEMSTAIKTSKPNILSEPSERSVAPTTTSHQQALEKTPSKPVTLEKPIRTLHESLELESTVNYILQFLDQPIKNKLYLVGGAIRDLYLKVIPEDYDFVYFGSILELYLIFKNVHFFECNISGSKKHPMLEIIYRNPRGKVTQLQICQNTSISLYENALQRDLSINAIYYCIGEQIYYDPFNGLNDLKMQQFRFIADNVKNRIIQDPSVLLRLIKMLAKYPSFKLHKDLVDYFSKFSETSDILTYITTDPSRYSASHKGKLRHSIYKEILSQGRYLMPILRILEQLQVNPLLTAPLTKGIDYSKFKTIAMQELLNQSEFFCYFYIELIYSMHEKNKIHPMHYLSQLKGCFSFNKNEMALINRVIHTLTNGVLFYYSDLIHNFPNLYKFMSDRFNMKPTTYNLCR